MSPRIRTIKPDIWQDEALGRVPLGARLLYIGMITQADDEGRLRASPALLRAALFPYDGKLTIATVASWLEELQSNGLVRLYVARFEAYADFPTWSKHQQINRATPSQLPAFQNHDRPEISDPFAGDSVSPHGAFTEGSRQEGKGREGNKSMSSRLDPSVREVWEAYAEHHPRAAFTTSGKNNRKSIIERALKSHGSDECAAAIHGIHASEYHVQHGYAGDLELTLRDADHIEKYAAIAIGVNGKPKRTMAEVDAIIAAHEGGSE